MLLISKDKNFCINTKYIIMAFIDDDDYIRINLQGIDGRVEIKKSAFPELLSFLMKESNSTNNNDKNK